MYQKFWYKLFWYRIIWQMYSWLKIIKWTVSRHVRVMRVWCWSGPSNKDQRVRQWHKSFLFWAYFRPKMETQNELLGRARRWVSLCNSFKNCIIFFSPKGIKLIFFRVWSDCTHNNPYAKAFLEIMTKFFKNLNWKQLSLLLLFNLKKTQWVDFKPKSVVSNTRKKF